MIRTHRLLNRYILKEIAIPFCMILFVLTFVLLMGKVLQLMDLMINKGVAFSDIARLIFFLLPTFLVFTLPISLLMAILIGLGRLSSDNEITVLKMSGVSLYRLSLPVAVAALTIFILTAATSLFLAPYGNHSFRNLLFDMAKRKASIGIREKVFIDAFRGMLLYADRISVQGDFLEGVLISDNRISREPSTIIARRAYLFSDPGTLAIILRLETGSTHTVDAGLKNYRKMDFSVYDVRLDFAASLKEDRPAGAKSGKEMTVAELIRGLKNRGISEPTMRELAIELNSKLAIPLACLVFALIGVPVGIRAHRSVRSRGLAIGLALVLVYYLLRVGGEALVETGRLSPIIGAWTPNAVFAVAGLILFYSAAREKQLSLRFRRPSLDDAPLTASPGDCPGKRQAPPPSGPVPGNRPGLTDNGQDGPAPSAAGRPSAGKSGGRKAS
ncbi:MAG: LPS export ABC transporter permease LptF [Proteobacteria bacterium]|nr:LPS export ABC transporter permease LptF [Pseudomonadota bacterium]MBU2226560.1 LPS export ABC transporter permease LptF [Pseudomonadota bacterium]MBU2262548.1 LPS export ABC transporter permease LptF [Pseudomonadota bacterium]